MSNFKTSLKIVFAGGYFTSDIESSIDEAIALYREAINNKKDRTFTVEAENGTVIFNVDNIIIFEVTPNNK